jgi:hypothetical protein
MSSHQVCLNRVTVIGRLYRETDTVLEIGDICHKTSHMVLSIIFLEDKHKILLHLSIFYEYQHFFQHRICFLLEGANLGHGSL